MSNGYVLDVKREKLNNRITYKFNHMITRPEFNFSSFCMVTFENRTLTSYLRRDETNAHSNRKTVPENGLNGTSMMRAN